MKHLRFDDYSSTIECPGEHPQETMARLGITYMMGTSHPISDQWHFWCCENIPANLPSFITELETDPMQRIGTGLSEEEAKLIVKKMNEASDCKKVSKK